MPRAYSRDLRERVVAFVGSERSRRAAAAHFDVSPSFVINLMTAYRAGRPGAQAGWRAAARQARSASRFSAEARGGEGRHHDARTGGRACGVLRHAGRSCLSVASAHPQRLSL